MLCAKDPSSAGKVRSKIPQNPFQLLAPHLSQLWTRLSVPPQTVKPASSPAALQSPNPARHRPSAAKKTEAPADTAPRRCPFQVSLLSDASSQAICLGPLLIVIYFIGYGVFLQTLHLPE